MSTHTPLPWATVRDNCIRTELWEIFGHGSLRIVYGKGTDVAFCPAVDGDNGNANTEFIVRACNAHDDLLAACKTARTEIWVHLVAATGDPGWKAVLDVLDAAIAQVEPPQKERSP